jgi:hypothetical protein
LLEWFQKIRTVNVSINEFTLHKKVSNMRLKIGNCKVSNRVLHRLKFGQHVRYQTWCEES